MAASVFASFHYDRDYWRVQQVLNMGVLDGQAILNSNDWEQIKRRGTQAIQNWIKKQMAPKTTLLVLVGAQTASREWVDYEIRHAWDSGKKVLGIRVHGLKNKDGYIDTAGVNPFSKVSLKNGRTLDQYVTLHEPAGANSQARYAAISKNISTWISNAARKS